MLVTKPTAAPATNVIHAARFPDRLKPLSSLTCISVSFAISRRSVLSASLPRTWAIFLAAVSFSSTAAFACSAFATRCRTSSP